MQLSLRYFAAAREAAGCEGETITLAAPLSVADLERHLVRRHPPLADLMASLRFAVGERFVDRDACLAEGDVVALLPPVSGG